MPQKKPSPERRGSILRRDLNDLVRGDDGKVSQAKLGALVGQTAAAWMLFWFPERAMATWDVLTVLLLCLIAPQVLGRAATLRWGGGQTK